MMKKYAIFLSAILCFQVSFSQEIIQDITNSTNQQNTSLTSSEQAAIRSPAQININSLHGKLFSKTNISFGSPE